MSEKRKRRAGSGQVRKAVLQILTWMLVAVILLIGYQSAELVKRILPDYRDKIVSYDQPDKSSLIYLQSDDELAVYPWDEFDGSQTVPYAEYVQEMIGKQIGLEMENAEEALAANPALQVQYDVWETAVRNHCEDICYRLTSVFVPWQKSVEWGDIYESAVWSGSTLYLRDHAIILSSGTSETAEYRMDFSMDMSGAGVFYHCREADRQELTADELNTAYETVRRDLESIRYLVTAAGDVSVSVKDNLFLRAFDRVKEHLFFVIKDVEALVPSPLSEYASGMELLIVECLVRGDDCDMIAYEGDLLLIFNGVEGERLILYYDVLHGEIDGFSYRN